MDNLKQLIVKAFESGVYWRQSPGKVILKNMTPETFMPDSEKYFLSLNLPKCDSCGQYFIGKKYPFYNENHKKEKGLIMCKNCFVLNT